MAETAAVVGSTAYEALTYQQLRAERTYFTEQATAIKGELAAIDTELTRRLGESATKALADAGKEYGTVNLPLQDGLVAKAVIDKKVEWDSEKLLGIAQSMPWDRVRAVFKIAFSVPETNYKGIAAVDPELCKRIDEARTTKYGAPKITIEEAK